MLSSLGNRSRREGPQGDGTDQTGLDAFFAQLAHGAAGNTGRGAVGDDHEIRVFGHFFLPAAFGLFHHSVLGVQLVHMLFQHGGIDVQGVDDRPVPAAVRRPAGRRPGLLRQVGPLLAFRHLHGLHHLADQAIAHDQHGIAVLVRQVKCFLCQFHCFLNGRGSQHQHPIVAVSAAAGRLIVVALGRLDRTQSGAAAHHVYDNAGQFRAHNIADAFLLQGDSRAGGRGHNPRSGAGRAVDHIDGGNFALRLQETAALNLRQPLGHVFRDLVLRGNGIAEEEAASCLDRGFGDGFISLHEHFFTHGFASSFISPL